MFLLKEIKTKYDIVLEAKAKLEDEVESLQSKIRLAGESLWGTWREEATIGDDNFFPHRSSKG